MAKLERATLDALDLPSFDAALNEDEKAELPPPGLLFRARSLDTGRAQIVNVPTVEQLRSNLHTDVVVPPRNVLVKMPFYSTPLTAEATNHAFRDFMVRLTEMGFAEKAEAALVATNAESVESAIDFIMNRPDALYHRFVADELMMPSKNEAMTTTTLCTLCGLGRMQHILDSNGDKIQASTNEDGDGNDDDNDTDNLLQTVIDHKLKEIAAAGDDVDTAGDEAAVDTTVHITIENGATKGSASTAQTAGNDNNENDNENENENEDEKESKEEKEEEQTPNNGPTELCLVCLEDRTVDMFHRAPCGHNYCKECLQTHYKTKTTDGDVLKLACIDPKCDRLIEEDEILSFLIDEEIKNKFKKFHENKLAMLNTNVRFCCKPDCEGKMVGSRINRRLVCPLCREVVCWMCGQPWHGYFVGCNQNVDIGYSRWALNKDVHKCPRCRMGIEKDDGCNHMTCSSCSYEFCWICKGPYNDYHFEWWNLFGCPGAQYTPRFCRCPYCFPRWFNRILIILCCLFFVVPFAVIAGVLWLVVVCLIICIRCDFECDDMDLCDCF